MISRRFALVSLLPVLTLVSSLHSMRAQGLLFTLRSGSFLSTEAGYDSKNRLSFSSRIVLVESPPLQEKGEFCLYRLFDEKGRSLEPETAWTPCFSIDTLFIRP